MPAADARESGVRSGVRSRAATGGTHSQRIAACSAEDCAESRLHRALYEWLHLFLSLIHI